MYFFLCAHLGDMSLSTFDFFYLWTWNSWCNWWMKKIHGICSRGFSGATVQISDQLKHYSLIFGIVNVKCTHLGEVTLHMSIVSPAYVLYTKTSLIERRKYVMRMIFMCFTENYFFIVTTPPFFIVDHIFTLETSTLVPTAFPLCKNTMETVAQDPL